MARYVRYETEDGTDLIFEKPAAAESEGEERVAAEDEVEEAGKSFEEALQRVKPMAERVIQQMQELSPGGIEVQFGVLMTGSLGAVFASAEASGHFQVTLKWDGAEGEKSEGVDEQAG